MDPVKDLSQWPPSWYLLGPTKAFGRQPKSLALGAKRLLVLRDPLGKPHALSAYCSHMGADLSYGRFDGQTVRCPMHGFAFDLQGSCVDAPGCPMPPQFARQTAFPVCEALGLLFAFDEPRAAFPWPFFPDLDLGAFAGAKPIAFAGEAPWFWVAANGFDVRHFRIVHGRRLLAPPVVTQTDPSMLKVAYRFELEGLSSIDRLLMKAFGKTAELEFTTWGGNIILAQSNFGGRMVSRFLAFVTPTAPLRCQVQIVSIGPRLRGLGPCSEALTALTLWCKRLLTRNFFREENKTLRNLGHAPVFFAAEDAVLKQFFVWLKDLEGRAPIAAVAPP